MLQEPLWNLWSTTHRFNELNTDEVVDVAIIGGGITGIQTAAKLKEMGYKVAVLEARCIGKGTTGQSTGNLYEITEDLFNDLVSKYDTKTVKELYAARKEGIFNIKENIRKYDISCDFADQTMHIMEDASTHRLKKELQTAEKIGMDISLIQNQSFNFPIMHTLQLAGQAQFNPLLYTQNLAQKITGPSVHIYENTPVEKITTNEKDFKVSTSKGNIIAKYVIQATHTPKGKEVEFHSVLGSYREFGIAAKIKVNTFPEGIFWYYFEGNKISFRQYTRGKDRYLILVGNQYKVGHAESEKDKLKELNNFAHLHFNIDETLYHWGGQNYKPADHLPYIGETSEGSRQYIATGFAADGLVYGSMAANILAAGIAGVPHSHSHLFKANRHQPIKAAIRFIKENKDTASNFISGLFLSQKDFSKLEPGSGDVFKLDNKSVAVYKHPSGSIHKLSAICPHMGCQVAWNNLEKSWDCPCHGSRFNVQGKLIEGPSWEDMAHLESE